MWLLVLFILVPLIEIALFIQVGGWLTLWPTLAVVVATAVIGTALVRQQGVSVLRQAQRALDELRDPLAPLAHGALILFAGALLLTPGFLTDAVGFALLIPGVRTALLAWAMRNGVHLRVFNAGPTADARSRSGPGSTRSAGRADVIEPHFEDVTDRPSAKGGAQPPSGWVRPPDG
ncbi:MAG: FxsA family protein [Alkalilacustris sp.]